MKLNFVFTFLVFVLCFHFFNCYNQIRIQEIIPPSPDAAQLGIFGNVPVGLFSGTIQHSIPIYELKTRDLSVPVILNYSSNGLIVDKVASWVGFDWSLDAGGIITSSVQGRQDFQGSGRQEVPSNFNDSPTALINFLKGQSVYDFQPDVYSFNFGPYSGKFIINADYSQVYIIPFQKLNIQIVRPTPTSKSINYFVITAPDGVKYKFTVKENYLCLSCSPQQIYPQSWYLTTIVHPSTDSINFYYKTPYWAHYFSGASEQISKLTNTLASGCEGFSCPFPVPTLSAFGVNSQITYLDSIVGGKFGKVIFQQLGARLDYTEGKQLDKIIIKNYKNEIIKTIDFTYQTITANINYQPLPNLNPLYISSTFKNDLKYRMFLTGLNFMDKSAISIEKYSFDYYNLDVIPYRLSFSQDHWGYFNGITNNHLLPQSHVPPQYLSVFTETYANRSPHGEFSQHGMLKKITYPTKGYTSIEYEPHNSGSGEIGGCRVKRVLTFENEAALPLIKRYYYNNRDNILSSLGYTNGLPTYFYSYRVNLCCILEGECSTYGSCEFGSLVSNSQCSLFVNGQNSIIYPNVTVSYGENFEGGGEQHSFEAVFDQTATPLNTSGGPVVPPPVYNTGWYAGKKSSELYFKKSASGQFVRVKEIIYSYKRDDTRNRNDYKCLAIVNRLDSKPPSYSGLEIDDLKFFDVTNYTVHSIWEQPSSTTVINYDDIGNAITNTTTYSFNNSSHSFMTSESTKNSKGQTIIRKMYYPQDYNSGVQNFNTLINGFIINKPIDSRTYSNGKITLLEQFKYNNKGQLVDYYNADISSTDIVFNTASPYTATHKISYLYDNITNNLIMYTPENDLPTTILWGYYNTLPVLKLHGLSYSQIPAAVKSNIAARRFSTSIISSAYKVDIDYLKTQIGLLPLTPLYMAEYYTYSPLFGMTSKTDTNGKSSFFEYENSGKLKTIRDQDLNIINEYKYNYKP